MENVAVSIICNTYNHEKYIRKALEGFVMQQTDFAFEVLVHDDASTDGTADIIREFEKKYPDIIKPIYETENQYSKHDGSLGRIQYGRAKGKYIALCEGDDYWIDPLKLQKQFDAMETHAEVDMCAHGAVKIDAITGMKIGGICPCNTNTVFSPEEVIMGEGGFVSTNSLFYRAALNKDKPRFRKNLPLDYTLQIQGSLRGGLLYLCDVMSAYRVSVPGSWTEKHRNINLMLEFNKKKRKMLEELDEDTNFKFTDTIKWRILKSEYNEMVNTDNGKGALSKKYRAFFEEEPLKCRIKIRIKAYFPFFVKLFRKMKCK